MAFELHEGKPSSDVVDFALWGDFGLVGAFATIQEAQYESYRIWDRSCDSGMPAGRKRIWDDQTANLAFPPSEHPLRFIIRKAPAG